MTTSIPELDTPQLEGKDFLVQHPHSGLFHKPGLGKTRTLLEAMEEAEQDFPVLVIAPKACVLHVWPQEIKKWVPHRSCIQVIGAPPERENILFNYGGRKQFDYYIMSYEMVQWFVKVVLKHKKLRFHTIVFDESSKMKSHKAKRFKDMATIVHNFRRRHVLTGTPVPNGYLQLWSQVFLVDLGESLSDNWYRYRARYFLPTDYKQYNWECLDTSIIEQRVQHLFHVRSTYDLPELVELPIQCDLGSEDVYHRMRRYGVHEELDILAETMAARQMKLRQISNGFIYDEDKVAYPLHTNKFDRLNDLLDELGDVPVMILYEFNFDRDMLKLKIKGSEIFDSNDPTMVDRWNAGKIKRLLLQPQSAGHGLNLQGAGNVAVWFNPPFDLELYIQTTARLWRRGQLNEVYVYVLVSVGSVDPRIWTLLTTKGTTQEDFLTVLEEHVHE